LSGGSSYVGYLNYIIFLFLGTGAFAIWVDTYYYKQDQGRDKERKATMIAGWTNISLGILAMIGSWIYKRYIW